MNKNIFILMNNFNPGGAEKFLIGLSNYLKIKNYNVTLIVLNENGILKENIDKSIKIINIKKTKFIFSIFNIVELCKINSPDYFITSLPHFNIGILLLKKFFNLNTRVIIREANVVNLKYSNQKIKDIFFIFMKKIFYKYAFAIVAVTNSIKLNMINYQRIKCDSIKVIYNPIFNLNKKNLENIRIKNFLESQANFVNILSIGRLVHQKDFKNLINAISIISNTINVRLILIGNGSLKKNLINQSKKLKLENNIKFFDKAKPLEIQILLNKCDLFVCSSLWEGVPNVLVEALKAEIPIVSTDFDSAYELLSDSTFFRISKKNDSKDLSNKILEILQFKKNKNSNNMWKKFSFKNYQKYEEIIK